VSGGKILKNIYNAVPPTSNENSNLMFICLDSQEISGDLSLCLTCESTVEEGENDIKSGKNFSKIPLSDFVI
jgi:hypothetical protein